MSYSDVHNIIDEKGFAKTFEQLVSDFAYHKNQYEICKKKLQEQEQELRASRLSLGYFVNKLQNLKFKDAQHRITQIVENFEGEKRLAVLNLVKDNKFLDSSELEIEFIKITDLESLDKEENEETN